jgi:hypothetical protein
VASVLAPVLVLALVRGATVDADLGLRLDSVTSTIDDVRTSTVTRTGLSALGLAAGILDTSPLRLTTSYSPRVWTSDVEAHPSPFVNHALDARLETQPDRPWRFLATAGGERGSTGPLLQASGTATATARPTQVPTTAAVSYEEVHGRLGLEVPLDLRTKATATGGAQVSRTIGADAALAPLQRGVSAALSLERLVTERDTLALLASGARTVTDVAGGASVRADSATAVGSWRRRLTPTLDGWVGAGATWLRTSIQPAGEVGLRGGDPQTTTGSAVFRATTFVDRFTGQVSPAVEARCDLTWRTTERLSLTVAASGGGRTDGTTSVAAATAQLSWLVRESLRLEAGVMGFGQHETQPNRPSFVEVAVFASVAYRQVHVFGTGAPPTDEGAGGPGQPR